MEYLLVRIYILFSFFIFFFVLFCVCVFFGRFSRSVLIPITMFHLSDPRVYFLVSIGCNKHFKIRHFRPWKSVYVCVMNLNLDMMTSVKLGSNAPVETVRIFWIFPVLIVEKFTVAALTHTDFFVFIINFGQQPTTVHQFWPTTKNNVYLWKQLQNLQQSFKFS